MSRVSSCCVICIVLAVASVGPRATTAFSCDATDEGSSARRVSDDAAKNLRTDNWFLEDGTLRFTHDPDYESDGSDWDGVGNPGMIYARVEVAGGLSPVFRLGPSDALVQTLCTPPPTTRYFSMATYVWRRQDELSFWPQLTVPGSRVVSATCGDPKNMLTTTSEAPACAVADTRCPAFSKSVVLISTGDAASFERIAKAFISAGMAAEAINLEVLPVDRVKFGRSLLLDGADDLSHSFRAAYWPGTGTDALGEYARQQWPVFIARSPLGGGRNSQPVAGIKAPLPLPKQLTNSEVHLRTATSRLSAAIKDHLTNVRGLRFQKESQMLPVAIDRARCLIDPSYSPFKVAAASNINIRSGCFGEISDCSYSISQDDFNAGREFVAVHVGVNHVELQNNVLSNTALYFSGGSALSAVSAGNVRVVVSADDRQWGGKKTSDSFVNLLKSTGKFSANNNRDEMYGVFAQAFASTGMCQFFANTRIPCVETAVVRGQTGFFINRDYLDANTGTAPDAAQMILPSIMFFE
mmetsp:Transcript_27242/g.66877  ORF Transcript_27242/g.66877 Transcript_27242/m.66877 type:complete len:524 (+) Transcript_27242:473-2044(+)